MGPYVFISSFYVFYFGDVVCCLMVCCVIVWLTCLPNLSVYLKNHDNDGMSLYTSLSESAACIYMIVCVLYYICTCEAFSSVT